MNIFVRLFGGGVSWDEEEIEVPKNLEMCKTESSVTEGLKKWAKFTGIVGQCVGLIILGIALFNAFQEGETSYRYDDTEIFCEIIVPGCFWSLAVMEVFDFAKHLMFALANIVHNTTVTARVALLNAEKILYDGSDGQTRGKRSQNTPAFTSATRQPTTVEQRAVISDGGWVCNCGHINSKVKTVCSRCGKARES